MLLSTISHADHLEQVMNETVTGKPGTFLLVALAVSFGLSLLALMTVGSIPNDLKPLPRKALIAGAVALAVFTGWGALHYLNNTYRPALQVAEQAQADHAKALSEALAQTLDTPNVKRVDLLIPAERSIRVIDHHTVVNRDPLSPAEYRAIAEHLTGWSQRLLDGQSPYVITYGLTGEMYLRHATITPEGQVKLQPSKIGTQTAEKITE